MTSSFDDRWKAMSDQIAGVLEAIYAINPVSRFGFTTFGDKPIEPLGYWDDYCLHVDKPLGQPQPEAMQELFASYTAKAQGGGNDWSEGVFEGIYRAIQSPAIGWDKSENSANVLVVVTDAVSHLPGDVADLADVDVPENSVTPESIKDNENAGCADMDYPSIDQVAKLINENKFKLIFLCAPGGTFDENGKFWPARGIALKGKKYRTEEGLALWYKDVLSDAGVEDVIIRTIDSDMNVYAESLVDALKELTKQIECPTTTTETPTESTTDVVTTDLPIDSTTEVNTANSSEDIPTIMPPDTTSTEMVITTTDESCTTKDRCCHDECDDCCHGNLRVRVEVHLGEPGEEPITNVIT